MNKRPINVNAIELRRVSRRSPSMNCGLWSVAWAGEDEGRIQCTAAGQVCE